MKQKFKIGDKVKCYESGICYGKIGKIIGVYYSKCCIYYYYIKIYNYYASIRIEESKLELYTTTLSIFKNKVTSNIRKIYNLFKPLPPIKINISVNKEKRFIKFNFNN